MNIDHPESFMVARGSFLQGNFEQYPLPQAQVRDFWYIADEWLIIIMLSKLTYFPKQL